MIKKKESKLKKIIFDQALFIKVMLLLMLITNFPYIEDLALFLMRFITVVWSPFILVYNLKYIKKNIKKNFYWLLLLFICSYSFTILINYRYNFIRNSKALVWFIIYIGILLIWWRNSENNYEKLRKDIRHINCIIVTVNLINVLPSLVLYIANICIRYKERPIGMYSSTNRLFGVMDGLNSSVMLAFISILAIAINLKLHDESPKKRVLYLINVISSYIFIIASGTRSVRFLVVCMVAFYVFIKLWEKWSEKFGSKVKVAIRSSMGFVVAFILVYIIVEITRYPIGMLHITNFIHSNNTSNVSENISDDTILTVRKSESEVGASLERFTIWKECIDLWKEYPFFGIGNANMKTYANISKKEFSCINDVLTSDYGPATHNMPLAVLLFSGIVGSAIFLGYLFLRMITAFIVLLNGKDAEGIAKSSMIFSFMVCMALCMYSMLGNVIIFTHVKLTVIFWIYLSIMEFSEYQLKVESEEK